MRVLITSHGYPPTVSGVTLVVQKLAHALVRRGHDVTVLAGSDRFDAYETEDAGVRVVRIASRKNPYWPANPVPMLPLDRFERFVSSEAPDVIHAHDPMPFLLQAVRARRRLGVPLVATCHYYPSFVTSYLTRHDLSARLVEDVAWQYAMSLYNRVDQTVFATFTQRDVFLRHGLKSPARVISNGVDTERYHPGLPSEELDSRYGLPHGGRVLAVGRLAKDKDLDVLIQSVAHTRATTDVHLLLVGKGPYRDALARYARDVGAETRVHFLGFVPEQDLPDLYRASDVFAISSPYEVQSIPALQAAASGIPIVAIDEGSLPEICRDGENGILVPAGESARFAAALDRALAPSGRVRMGLAGRALGRLHDEAHTFDAYEALYDQSLARTERESAAPPEATTT